MTDSMAVLRAAIAAETERQTQLMRDCRAAEAERLEAEERQKLRRDLESQMISSQSVADQIRYQQALRRQIDADYVHSERLSTHVHDHVPGKGSSHLETINYNIHIIQVEHVWCVQGLSWLLQSLTQEQRNCVSSDVFKVDANDTESSYRLVFSPNAIDFIAEEEDDFQMFDKSLQGSLALVRAASSCGTNIEVNFFVEGRDGFVQWGESTRMAWPGPADEDEGLACLVLGPDLDAESSGVFGLSFQDLLRSQWVRNDEIKFKVQIKERAMPNPSYEDVIRLGVKGSKAREPEVEVPPSTLAADMLSMLIEGRHSDLTLEVSAADGGKAPVRFSAHANILSQRSEVFRLTLSHEMRESETRTIVIRDLEPLVIKALLHFLYADDFESVEKVLGEEEQTPAGADTASSSTATLGEGGSDASRWMARLRALLAAAHRYQVTRLLRWCEQQLCKHLDQPSVCELLELSLLYEAVELQAACLKYIKAHMAEVVKLAEFATLSSSALVRVHMHVAGVEPPETHGRKRKRGEE